MGENLCIRLYNGENVHCLTILPCCDKSYDLCRPNGNVVYCGIPKDLMEVIAEEMGLEPISEQHTLRKM